MRLLLKNGLIAIILAGSPWLTGCQSANNTQAQTPMAETAAPDLPDFSSERAANEAATFNSYKSKPDFTQLDVVAIVPAEEN